MSKAILFFTATFLFSHLVQATLTCRSLFTMPIPRDTIQSETFSLQTVKTEAKARLIIGESDFVSNPNQSVIELIRLLVQNSSYKLEDKNVLTKNKFTLGVEISTGYFLELTYESKSNTNPRFILQDKIVLITPSGKKITVTEDLIRNTETKINKSDFDISEYFGFGVNLKLLVPLVVEGAVLKKFSSLAEYFEYFEKDEIARIFKSSNMVKIETLFKIRKAKKVFFNVLIREPFKLILGGAVMFAVYNSQVFLPTHTEMPAQLSPQISAQHVQNTLNNMPIPSNRPDLKKEYSDLQAEIAAKVKNRSYANLGFHDIQAKAMSASAHERNMFVYEKLNENTGSIHTYVVVAEDASTSTALAMKFVVIEISATRYKKIIAYLKEQ